MYPGEDHPKTKDCKEFSIPAFNGLAQVIIQSKEKAGQLLLTCTSDDLKSSNLLILCH